MSIDPHVTSVAPGFVLDSDSGLSVESDAGMWLGLPVTRYRGNFEQLRAAVPRFVRRPFETAGSNGKTTSPNPYYDAIIRLPKRREEREIPVGVVSRVYALVQHQELIERVAEVLSTHEVDVSATDPTISLTPHGERMALSVVFPDESRFSYQVGADDSMRFRLELFNSVDGSTRLMVVIGWLRFVCNNGLVIGKAVANVRRAHSRNLDVDRIAPIIAKGIRDVDRQRALWKKWRTSAVSRERLRRWVDTSSRRAWGIKAAARVYSICATGSDLVLTDPFEIAPPSERTGRAGGRVTGAPDVSENAFDVAQALSWVAGQRHDMSVQLEATREIPDLIRELTRRGRPKNGGNN